LWDDRLTESDEAPVPARFVQDQRQILNPRNHLGERSDVITRPDGSQIWQSPGLTLRNHANFSEGI
jgi:hypothetical protein